MNCFKRAYMCRASRRPLQHLIPPSTSFPQIQETAVQLLLYHKDADSLADFPRRPSSPLIARVSPRFFISQQSLSSGGASKCRCYTLRMTLTRSYLFIYLLILHLRDPLLNAALLWLYRWLYSPFKWLYRCYLFLFHPYLHQTDVFYLSPFPSPPSVPPSLPDTVCVSRCVLGLSGWPLFLLHSFIIPRIHPSLYPLTLVQSVNNCGFGRWYQSKDDVSLTYLKTTECDAERYGRFGYPQLLCHRERLSAIDMACFTEMFFKDSFIDIFLGVYESMTNYILMTFFNVFLLNKKFKLDQIDFSIKF